MKKKLGSIIGITALILTLGMGTLYAQQQAPPTDRTTAWCYGGGSHGDHGYCGHSRRGCGW